jgi:glyceraldehyde 3-phosphate dehydrogenase
VVTRIAIAGHAGIAARVRAALSVHPALCEANELELVCMHGAADQCDCTGLLSGGLPSSDTRPWQKLAIDIVLDCSDGDARAHLAAGARRVLRCTPDASRPDITVIYGVNHARLCESHRSVHGANGAAHCIAPVARVLHYALGISSGIVTVMHPSGIACDSNPSSCARVAPHLESALPALEHRFDETAPIALPNGPASLVGLVFEAQRETSVEEVNALVQCASFGAYGDLLLYSDVPFSEALSDRDTRSSVFEAGLTRVSGRMVKICAGYRSDWGFCNRLIDTVAVMARL